MLLHLQTNVVKAIELGNLLVVELGNTHFTRFTVKEK